MRTLAAAELRSITVALSPRSDWRLTALATGLGAAAVGAAAAGQSAILVAALAGGLVAATSRWWSRRVRMAKGLLDASMEITPWGIVANSDRGRTIVPWTDVRAVKAETVRKSDRGPLARGSEVVHTHIEVTLADATLVGAIAREEPAVLVLQESFRFYAHEAKRLIALDLDGKPRDGDVGGHGSRLDASASTPVRSPSSVSGSSDASVFDTLRGAARRILDSPEGAATLGLSWSGYRSGVITAAGPETVATLRAALSVTAREPDRAPLVAVLAVELGAWDLSGPLLQLIMSPNPFVAAVCKAAALRLGEAPFRPGPVSEVAPFLSDNELTRIEAWSRESHPGAREEAGR